MNKTLMFAMGGLLASGPAFAQQIEKREIRIAMPAMKRADVEAQVKAQFQKLDADKDGSVTRAEMTAQRTAQMKSMQDEMFSAMDSNKDGSVSRAEFDSHHAAMAPVVADALANLPEAAGATGTQVSPHMAGHDAHHGHEGHSAAKDGAAPTQRRIVMMRHHAKGDAAPMMLMVDGSRMFDMADGDKDGKVTEAEAVRTALARFDKADTNKDGILAPEERRANRMTVREVIKTRRTEK